MKELSARILYDLTKSPTFKYFCYEMVFGNKDPRTRMDHFLMEYETCRQ